MMCYILSSPQSGQKQLKGIRKEEISIDERTARMIAEYIPGEPDPTLELSEYYFLQQNTGRGRIIRVFALDCLPHKDGTRWGCYTMRGGRLVHVDDGWGGDPFHGIYKSQLYDNKDDCRNQTHSWVENWEDLREIQRREVNG